MNTAVLVIDVQQGLCEGEGAAFDCEGTIARINSVTRKAREAGAPVIFVQHESNSGYLEHGSAAWQLANKLEVDAADIRVRKTTPDSFLHTELEAILQSRGIKTVVLCGMHSEFCVDTTARRALALGFPVVLVSDAHTSAGNSAISAQQVIAHHNATLTNISSFGPRVRTVSSENVKIAVHPPRQQVPPVTENDKARVATVQPPEELKSRRLCLRKPVPTIVAFLTDVERLKLVNRAAYVSDLSRRENSAEHSWHLALGLLAIARELKLEIDLPKALVMALIHDACEIDAGDTPAYGPERADQHDAERLCIDRLAGYGLIFGAELRDLWLEYEAQETIESRWVKVLDRLMPFVVNLATQGKTWREQSVARSQVLRINEPVQQHAPELYGWMVERIHECVVAGWLRDA